MDRQTFLVNIVLDKNFHEETLTKPWILPFDQVYDSIFYVYHNHLKVSTFIVLYHKDIC